MSNVSIEERLAALERAAQKEEAIHQIQNLMGRYSMYHTAGMHKECSDELFVQHTPGGIADIAGIGVWEGDDCFKRCYEIAHDQMEGEGDERAGLLLIHCMTTPIIEVAGDLRTAKGTWLSPGVTGGPREDGVGCNWAWCKYGCDFIVEDGVWKIWHLHVYGIFTTPYEQNWATPQPKREGNPEDMWADIPEGRPDRFNFDTTFNYRPDLVYPVDQPVIPRAYDTWED